jgi:hypothetical protein
MSFEGFSAVDMKAQPTHKKLLKAFESLKQQPGMFVFPSEKLLN